MQKIKSIIVDDEPGNVITLTKLLNGYCTEIEVLGTAANPLQAYDLIKKTDPQLVFLDIEMPYGNAFDLLDKITPVTFEVIFITAFNNYAIKAFKYAAIDYILKPVNITELKDAIKKVSKRLEENSINARINSLLNNLKPENQSTQKIALPTIEGFRFEDVNSITHLQADGSYTHVFFKDKKKELVSKAIKYFEDILPEAVFCRVHHSHIININYIKKYYKGRGGYVEMEDGTTVEISTRKKDDFLEKFRL
jgi:two-component system LytT family response regulator